MAHQILKLNRMARTLNSLTFLLLIVAFLSAQGWAQRRDQNQADAVSADTPAEREIRAGYCDYQHKNYAGAQSHFSKALELDPKQKYAQFLIAAMLKRQFKPGDKSPENIAIARQAIAAYQKTIDNTNSDAAQKEEAEVAIDMLYGQVSPEEQQRELLARATSPTRPKEKRAEAYWELAGRAWNCSREITESGENKRTVKRNGETVIAYIMPKDATVFDKARTCALTGLDYANQAISLDANNESGWSYKTELLHELEKLAEMKGENGKKVEFEKQAEEAQAVTTRLYAEKEKKAKEQEQQQAGKADSFSVEEPSEQIKAVTTEFTYFKSEPKISDLVEEMGAVGLAMLAEEEETNRRKRAEAAPQVKRDWKEFKPEGEEFSVMMPSPVKTVQENPSPMWESNSEGISYSILSLQKPELPDLVSKYGQATYNSMVLNTAAHGTAPWVTNFFRGNLGTMAEVKLVRKEPVGGRQSRQYAITVNTCDKTYHSVLNYYSGSKHTYMILILGADENDPGAQRLLRSWRIG